MNPCSKNKKAIAMLAVNALDLLQALELREHFSKCPGCHAYWDEMRNIGQALATGAPVADVDPSQRLYKKLEARLKTAHPDSGLEHLGLWMGRVLGNWRVGLPAGALALVVFIVVFRLKQDVRPFLAERPVFHAGSTQRNDLPPTIANYRIVASQSLEQFSELLDRQGNKPLPPAPIYTASGGILAKSL